MLYIERRHFYVASLLITVLHRDIGVFLDNQKLPFFVRQVLPGIGFGSTPHKDSLSFGASRANVIAGAILHQLNGRQGAPVDMYLNQVWGDIGNFYLNPKSPRSYDFSIFGPCDQNLFPDALSSKPLTAAWYIAKLLCREAIWVSHDECNWMNYQLVAHNLYGYRFMDASAGLNGLEGIITFLEAFEALRIQDPIIEKVLRGAREFGRTTSITNHSNQGPIKPLLQKAVVPPETFKSDVREEVKSAITEASFQPTMRFPLLNKIISNHIERERPIGNMLDGTDHFCADIRFGFAAYGYAFLRLHDPVTIEPLELTF